MLKKRVFVVLILAFAITVTASVEATIPGPGTQVAIVPNPASTNGGVLPSTDPAFANFTFTNLPWANVNAGNLTAYQIVVLVIDAEAPSPILSPSQVTDLNNWTYYGGKLIIYDSEMSTVDYSWLPYPFTTTNPGALGATGTILYMEDNVLGRDDNPASAYYINSTVDYVFNNWQDAIGDANVMTTFDPNWCGDIEAQNALFATGWVHTYAQYGSGEIIYNGFDIDWLAAGTAPGTININALAKIYLLELKEPWGDDFNKPCERKPVPPVSGEILPVNTLLVIAPYLLMLALVAGTIGFLFRKRIR